MWYVPNLQVDEGSSGDQVGEVNTLTATYFNVTLNKGLKNVIYCLSKHSCQGTYLLDGW